jgi:enoyl-CoA hydratase
LSHNDELGSTPVLTVENGRATVRLNRPRQLNKLTADDLTALSGAFAKIDDDPSIRVVVLTGTGRIFSAGYDLGDVAARANGAEEKRGQLASPPFEAVCDQLENLGPPTICMLNGGVYGGSTDLALACDFRIGVDTCEMFMPAARLGLHYYKGGMRRYVTRLGLSAAKKLFLTAQKIDAREMLRIGYLDEIVPAGQLTARVDELAATITGNAPLATRGMKRTLNEIARNQLDEAAADRRHDESFLGAELREGSAAFAAKRPPRF